MINYILASVLIILVAVYELWNQKKNREAEWYFHDLRVKEEDFHNTVLAFLSELRTEPENTRRMLRKLSFDDMETKLKNELDSVKHDYHDEITKNLGSQNSKRISNLAGRIDGLDYALELLRESKPKSYKESPKETDPTMPKKLQDIYYDSLKKMMETNYENEKEKLS